jgi:hypothetical protein
MHHLATILNKLEQKYRGHKWNKKPTLLVSIVNGANKSVKRHVFALTFHKAEQEPAPSGENSGWPGMPDTLT